MGKGGEGRRKEEEEKEEENDEINWAPLCFFPILFRSLIIF